MYIYIYVYTQSMYIHNLCIYTYIHIITPYYSQSWSYYDHNNNTSKSSYPKEVRLFHNADQYGRRGDMDLRKLSFAYHHHFGLFWAITFERVFLSKGPLPSFRPCLIHNLFGHFGKITVVKFMEKMSRNSSGSGEPEHIRDKRNNPNPDPYGRRQHLSKHEGFHVLNFVLII